MYEITALSTAAQALLCSADQGIVHSVYDKTINLSCGEALLSLQAKGTVSSPLSLMTSCSPGELHALGARSGIPVRFFPDGLSVGGSYFNTMRASRWDPYIAHFLPSAPSTDLNFLLDCLRGIMPKGGLSSLVLPDAKGTSSAWSTVEAAEILSSAHPALSARNWALAARQLSALIGLGEGLTPSGDDFLCGLLAASHLIDTPAATAFRKALCAVLPALLTQTNHISAGFLRCAMEGQFSRPVIALAQGVSLSSAQASFAAIGHSSGADTLSGMVFLFSALSEEQEIENSAGSAAE